MASGFARVVRSLSHRDAQQVPGKGQYEDRGACDALRNRPRLNAAKSSRCTWNQRPTAVGLEKSTEIIFALCKSAWLLENAVASNSSAACLNVDRSVNLGHLAGAALVGSLTM